MGATKTGRNAPCPCGSGKKYKKCCGHPGVSVSTRPTHLLGKEKFVRAYTDETGNSGNKLFDTGQDYFWTGTLVCEFDVDKEGASTHAKCLELAGKTELHGNELGLTGIEKIARKLHDFFVKHGCWFCFTRLEKNHLAATKFFDTLMDSGINHAVSNLHYGVRLLRLSLAVQFIQLLDDRDRREFWEVYETGDTEGFRGVLGRIRDHLISVHEEGIYHDRTVQLLRDGIEWGMAYPEPFVEQRQSELDSPNIVAFSLLVSMLHRFHEETGAKVASFIHDEQNQFGRYLRDSYRMLRHFNFETTIVATLLDMKELPTFGCDLVMTRSHDSVGLQFIDVALWLTKRFRESDGNIYGDCRRLALTIIERGAISSFTLDEMQWGVVEMLRFMDANPPAEERMREARKIVQEIEERRLARMKQPPSSN